jgi:hypothetical protein
MPEGGYSTSNRPGRSKATSDKPTADTMTPETIKAIVMRAFNQAKELRYGELRTNIIEASQYVGATLAKSRAEEFIRRITLTGILTKVKPDKSQWEAYCICPDYLNQQLS